MDRVGDTAQHTASSAQAPPTKGGTPQRVGKATSQGGQKKRKVACHKAKEATAAPEAATQTALPKAMRLATRFV